MRFSIAISTLLSFKCTNAFTINRATTSKPSPLTINHPPSSLFSSKEDGWYDDYDDFVGKLNFNDGGWDDSGSNFESNDRPRKSRSSGGARRSKDDLNDYTRDPADTTPVDEGVIHNLLSERTLMRRKGMFGEADDIRDELLNVYGVTVWDRDRVWTTSSRGRQEGKGGGRGRGRGERRDGRGGGRGSGRGRGRERRFNENGHDYHKAGGPIDPAICKLPEREIHMLIRERMECKFDRNFEMADSIQRELLSYGVEVHDGFKEWRADGMGWGGFDSFRGMSKEPRGPKAYSQRGPGAGLSEEDVETISNLVAERSEAKMNKDFDKADSIFEKLGDTYNVNVDDRAGEWALRNEEYQMSSNSAIIPNEDVIKTIGKMLGDRILARKNRDFGLADQIRMELEKDYLVRIDDRSKEWRVVQPEGAKWADGDGEEDEYDDLNFVSKSEFENDEDEMGDENDLDDDVEDDDDDAASSLNGVSEINLSSLTVPQLKEKLREAGLPVSGVKSELIERLSTMQ